MILTYNWCIQPMSETFFYTGNLEPDHGFGSGSNRCKMLRFKLRLRNTPKHWFFASLPINGLAISWTSRWARDILSCGHSELRIFWAVDTLSCGYSELRTFWARNILSCVYSELRIFCAANILHSEYSAQRIFWAVDMLSCEYSELRKFGIRYLPYSSEQWKILSYEYSKRRMFCVRDILTYGKEYYSVGIHVYRHWV